MSLIYLVRHGQASFGAASYDQLSSLGEKQAAHVGNHLSQLLDQTPYVISGTMQRHIQTAEHALAQQAQIVVHQDDKWNEFHHQQVFARYDPRFDQPELLKQEVAKVSSPRAYLAQIFEAAIARWTSGTFDQDYDETWLQFQARVGLALDELKKQLSESKAQSCVVFTSGGVISVAMGHVMGLSAQQIFALNWSIANTSITTLRLINNQFHLVSFNEHQFIQTESKDLLTWL